MSSRAWRAYVWWGQVRQRIARRRWPTSLHHVSHGWPLRPEECPCDVHFCDYLQVRDIRGQRVFHFGTGSHHLVGLRNQQGRWDNDILGLTLSPREHGTYVRRVIRDPALAARYKVLFADVHSLSAAGLPLFDVATLFHLCEFGDAGSTGRRLDERGVLQLFIGRLAPGGRLLFYRGSFGFPRAASLIGEALTAGQLVHLEDFRSLSIYRATAIAAPVVHA